MKRQSGRSTIPNAFVGSREYEVTNLVKVTKEQGMGRPVRAHNTINELSKEFIYKEPDDMRNIVMTTIALLLIVSRTFAGEFADNGNGTVTDSAAELMWQQGEGGLRSWQDVSAYCAALSLAGHDDWRLPTVEELRSLADETLGYHGYSGWKTRTRKADKEHSDRHCQAYAH